MSLRTIQIGAATFLALGAFGFSLTDQVGTMAGDSAKLPKLKQLQITYPTSPSLYGVGMYTIEGFVEKKQRVNLVLDGKVVDVMTATLDGSYFTEVVIEKAGTHHLILESGSGDDKRPLAKLDFIAVDKKVVEVVTKQKSDIIRDVEAEVQADDEHEPTGLLPNDIGDDVVISGSHGDDEEHASTAEKSTEATSMRAVPLSGKPTDVKKPIAKTPASGAKPVAKKPAATKLPAKVSTTKSSTAKKPIVKKPVGKKAVAKKVPFGISSHANFNVVPHGMVKFGGKGKPGDRVMLLIDGKPIARGMVKANGRWQLPVNVSKAGTRKVSVQNLRTREAKALTLKFK